MCDTLSDVAAKPGRGKMLSVRASTEEIAAVKRLASEIRERNRYVKDADVLRELIGVTNSGIVTQADRRRLLAYLSRDKEPADPVHDRRAT